MSGPEQAAITNGEETLDANLKDENDRLREQLADAHAKIRGFLAAKPGSERVAELVAEGNELRKLIGEILYVIEGGFDGTRNIGNISESSVAIWRERAGLPSPEPAVVTAGTEHLAEKIRGLAIPDEEN